MSRPIYSTRFLTHAGLSGRGASFTVPVGFVAIVRQVTIYSDAGLGSANIFLEDEPSGAALLKAHADGIDPTTATVSYFFNGSIVFLALSGFHFQADVTPGVQADCTASGYLLAA